MTQIKINHGYDVLLLLLKKEMHGRELAKELNTSLTRVQTILTEFRKINILDYTVEGKNHVYFIKKNLVSRTFVLNAENYKLAKVLRKHPFLEPIFAEIIDACPHKMIILFGSYAKLIPKKDSDIDVYIDMTDKKLAAAVKNIYDDLSIQTRVFDKNDLLIKEIIKNHILIRGGEAYYEKLGFFN